MPHSFHLVRLPLLGFGFLLLASPFMELEAAGSGPIFREYIGALFNGVKLSDVPINPSVETHLILAFAIDYTAGSPATPTNGQFNIFWDSNNISPTDVAAFKAANPNAKVALSLGGDSVGATKAFFQPSSVDSWVDNAVSSLKSLIQQYGIDGIDIDYEHFQGDPATFADCIGNLLTKLKSDGDISFASIAPFDDSDVQARYQALWNKYGSAVIDYVNFQFYAYAKGTTVEQFLGYFDTQLGNYPGGTLLASFTSDGSGGLSPQDGFFAACTQLKQQGKLGGIFVWCADSSKVLGGFQYEKQAMELLAGA